VRFGSGVQNKVLEALAMEVPVVATPLAAAGLRTPEGAEPPLDRRRTKRRSPPLWPPSWQPHHAAAPPSAAARHYVEEHFTWSASAAKLEVILRRVAQSRIATVRRV
jgi:glycosyltransferase involved in cell wall biosynthesis